MGDIVGIIIVILVLIALVLIIKGIRLSLKEAQKKPPRERLRSFMLNFLTFILEVTGIDFLIAICTSLWLGLSNLLSKIKERSTKR